VAPIVSVQNRYNLRDRSSDRLIDICAEAGIALFRGTCLQRVGLRAQTLRSRERRSATASQISFAWLLQRSPAMLPIPGTSSPAARRDRDRRRCQGVDAAACRIGAVVGCPCATIRGKLLGRRATWVASAMPTSPCGSNRYPAGVTRFGSLRARCGPVCRPDPHRSHGPCRPLLRAYIRCLGCGPPIMLVIGGWGSPDFTPSCTAILSPVDLMSVPGRPAAVNQPTRTSAPPSTGSATPVIQPEVMVSPLLWLVSDAAANVTGRRFLGIHWDPELPPEQAAEKAGAPVAWTSIATMPITPSRS
jgi:hypothetical protein